MEDINFKYNEGETMTQFLRRAEQYKIKLMSDKYTIVINFINELLELSNTKYKIKSLRDFKKINEDDLIQSSSHNKKIIKKYLNDFSKILSLEFSKEKIKTDVKYVIYVLQKILCSINFKLKISKYESKNQLSIKC
jgi:hypothetical protein